MILVTGATGLLGTHVLLELLSRGEEVKALYRSEDSKNEVKSVFRFYKSEGLFSRITWVQGDVMDVFSLLDAMEGVDDVIHCAAIVSYHKKDRKEMYRINVEGTTNVVSAALEAGVKKMCHVSSIAALRRAEDGATVNEEGEWLDSPLNTHYGITKHLAEMEVWRGIQEGLNAVIVNPGLIIGPGNFDRSSGSLFSKLDEGLKFYPPGGTGFVGAADTARLIVLSTKSDVNEERYIAVSESLTMKEVFAEICKELGKPIPDQEAKPWMLKVARFVEAIKELFSGKKALVTRETVLNASSRYYYSSEKSKKVFTMEYTPIAQCIQQTAVYFKQQR
jgi:nucleoside-diphosphate-sugar epimerase